MEALERPPLRLAIYWRIWALLLGITVAMLWVKSPLVIIAGISVKALLIMLWFRI